MLTDLFNYIQIEIHKRSEEFNFLDNVTRDNAEMLKILSLIRKNRSWSNVSDTTNEIYAFIKENCTSDISACDIAEKFHISLSLLEKKLKASYDMSPIKLKNFLRIEKSKHLLAQGYTIEEAAEKTGFCDRYHFTKTFTYFVRQSPSFFYLKPENINNTYNFFFIN